MASRQDITYFGAGPAALPTPIMEQFGGPIANYKGLGIGLLEISHRSKEALDIINEAKADILTFLDIPDDYEVLFTQGGGTGQFSVTLYNLLGVWVERRKQKILKELGIKKEISNAVILEELKRAVQEELKVDYLITGSWSLKASKAAEGWLGTDRINVAADARKVNDGKFGKIPEESTWNLSKNPAMVYYCDNETVDGVEFPGFPEILKPKGTDDDPIVVADMSSNIMSRRIPIKNFSVIFFGAQKNLGCAGLTVVIIKKSLLPPAVASPPKELLCALGLPHPSDDLNYGINSKNNSLYNTTSIFDVYIAGQVVKNSLASFPNKIDDQEKVANEKAQTIYSALEKYPDSYKIVPDKNARSRMNICFRVTHLASGVDDSEKAFLAGATEQGLTGLKGHRSVGGIRASNYNSISMEGAQKLAAFIENFAQSPK